MISAKKNSFIVEFRPSTIRAARISSESTPTVVEEVMEIDLSKEDSPADSIREFAKAKANAYMHASCSVFPDDRLVRQILVDTQRGKEVDFIFKYLRESASIDPDSFSVYCISPKDGSDVDLASCNKKEVLICGASKKSVSEIQDELVRCGVYPRRLEIGTIGAVGALKDQFIEDANSSPILFLEIDSDFTYAVIVGPKGVEMARKIDCGSKLIAQSLKEEMNLKDELAAEKILQSAAFDLGPMAPKLLRKLLRELQSSIGFFEVQTGSSVTELYCLKEGKVVSWLESSICELLNLKPLALDLTGWFEKSGVSFASEEVAQKLDTTWMSLFSLVQGFKGEGSSS